MGSSASKGGSGGAPPPAALIRRKKGGGAAAAAAQSRESSWYAPLSRTSSAPISYRPPPSAAAIHPPPLLPPLLPASSSLPSLPPLHHHDAAIFRQPPSPPTTAAATSSSAGEGSSVFDNDGGPTSRSRSILESADRSMSFDRVHGLDSCFSEVSSTSGPSAASATTVDVGALKRNKSRCRSRYSRFRPVVEEEEEEGCRAPDSNNNTAATVIAAAAAEMPTPTVQQSPVGSPLFDPMLLATFEKALLDAEVVGNDWSSTTDIAKQRWSISSDSSSTSDATSVNTNNCNNNRTTSSSSSSSSSSSPAQAPLPQRCEIGSQSQAAAPLQNKRSGSTNVRFRWRKEAKEEEEGERESEVKRLERRCPPRGEGKVVLYFTSLRGVRKTFDDCRRVRQILEGIGVDVDERDVWMHAEFRAELANLLLLSPQPPPPVPPCLLPMPTHTGTAPSSTVPPRLFVDGLYIGGIDEIVKLHDDGQLESILDSCGLHKQLVVHARRRKLCRGCNGIRFLPCLECRGSRKVVDPWTDTMRRCRRCNENGLVMCPVCSNHNTAIDGHGNASINDLVHYNTT